MAKFSLCGEEDGEGPSSPRPKRLRFSLQTNNFIDQNEPQHQEEEDEEEGEGEGEGEGEDETYEEEDDDDEEEETIYEEDTDEEEQDQPENPATNVTVGPRSTIDNTHVTPHADDGSITVTLTDPEVLDCSICLDHLSIPVFQVSIFFSLSF
jgi:E3 ubiquitin-protein ligase SIAH1|uniref:Uncharacterized protein n=1 Tax=Fagus sylvatica TaxID=28930 RepID=A0A2N9IJR7_FAGSY